MDSPNPTATDDATAYGTPVRACRSTDTHPDIYQGHLNPARVSSAPFRRDELIRFEGHREPVRVGFLEPEIVQLLNLTSVWSARHAHDVIVTSLNDHKHAERSLHYEDKAADFQVKVQNIPNKEAMESLANFLRGNLGLGWDLIWDAPGHYNHIHVEWDIRQRERKAD
jgi:hypothetical protein